MFPTVIVVWLFLALQQKSFAEDTFGYVINDALFPCIDNPVPDLCSNVKHQVFAMDEPSEVRRSLTSFTQILEAIHNYMAMQTANHSVKTCASSIQQHVCTQAFRLTCADGSITDNVEEIKKSCDKAKKHCANVTDTQLPFKSLINCSTPISPIGPTNQQRLGIKCAERFPEVKNDTYPCKPRNYKVLALNLTEQARNQVAAHERLSRYARDINKECLDNVSEAICKGVAPACDRNETVAVSLLSRQDCERIISCLNKTSKVKDSMYAFFEQCRTMPDARTARKIPLSLVYTELKVAHDITPTTNTKTKISTTSVTETSVPNKTTFENTTENYTDPPESEYTTKPTEKPLINATNQDASRTGITNTPTQMNQNPNSSQTTPAVNTASHKKTTTNVTTILKPTTKPLSNMNYTTSSQRSNGITDIPYSASTTSLAHNDSATIRPVASNITRHSAEVNSTQVVPTNATKNPDNKAPPANMKTNVLITLFVVSTLSFCN